MAPCSAGLGLAGLFGCHRRRDAEWRHARRGWVGLGCSVGESCAIGGEMLNSAMLSWTGLDCSVAIGGEMLNGAMLGWTGLDWTGLGWAVRSEVVVAESTRSSSSLQEVVRLAGFIPIISRWDR